MKQLGGFVMGTAGSVSTMRASGVFSVSDACELKRAGNWPDPDDRYVDTVFSTHLYTGNGGVQQIKNGINLAGVPADNASERVRQVFGTTLYTGNGNQQVIENGIDLANQGGMVWVKDRGAANDHRIIDTVRGLNNVLTSNSTAASNSIGYFVSATSTGFSLGTDAASYYANATGNIYASWTFRKAPKFFDVVTWTGNGTAGRTIAHSLGVAPGMIIVKKYNTSGQDWFVYHRSQGATKTGYLNATSAFATTSLTWNDTEPTESVFSTNTYTNGNGDSYVAYLFAHDSTTDGIIQCGSYTGNGSASGVTVNLGWEPQYLLIKAANDTAGTDNWYIIDNSRGMVNGGDDKFLITNTSGTEYGAGGVTTTSTGFYAESNNDININSGNYIYLAIRKPKYTGTNGGMVWVKSRANLSGPTNHMLFDTARGVAKDLRTNLTNAELYTPGDGLSAFNSNGFTLPSGWAPLNYSGDIYTSWTFKRAPRFFDVVTYTGNGGTKTVSHSLGVTPGMIIVKRTDTTGDWPVYHRSEALCGFLNYTNGFASAQRFSSVTSTDFTINVSTADCNANNATYVAYLFAHDSTTDGIIQCGSFTSGSATINLGWEPQWLLVKESSAGGVSPYTGWMIFDNMRGIGTQASTYYSSDANYLSAQATTVETTGYGPMITPTGFKYNSDSGQTMVYVAIRRSNKPPTSGTQVFQPTVYTGTNVANRFLSTTIAPDFVMLRQRDETTNSGLLTGSRLTSQKYMRTGSTAAETESTAVLDQQLVSATEYGTAFSSNSGVYIGHDSSQKINANTTSNNHIALAFKRAVGVFDEVCYTGTGSATTVSHGLGVVPEMIICKLRGTASGSPHWAVYHKDLGATYWVGLNRADAATTDADFWNNTAPTSSLFSVGTNIGQSSATYIARLFASKAGISKVGSYTGNGSSQTINCGFAAGARFVLIKRTDVAGFWYIFDSVRGIIAGNDPYINLDQTYAENGAGGALDLIDPDNSGFIVNQETTCNMNVTSASYCFLAFA